MPVEVVDEEVNIHRNHVLYVISSYFPAYAFCFIILNFTGALHNQRGSGKQKKRKY